jgi:hypothetical protein
MLARMIYEYIYKERGIKNEDEVLIRTLRSMFFAAYLISDKDQFRAAVKSNMMKFKDDIIEICSSN